MPFVVSFQKMDPNLDAVIIGAEVTHSGANIIGVNFSYVADDVASLKGRRHKTDRSGRPYPSPSSCMSAAGAPYGRSGAPYSAPYVSVPFSLSPDLVCHCSSP
jgi:hypothetical protein